ncbi:MAG TPA: phosphatase PAP2 family protein [Xanthobacteraceae bacterium]
MNRTGLLIALALAVAVGLLFGIYPKLDLDLERMFYDPAAAAIGGFWALYNPVLNRLRDLARLISALLVAPAVLAVVGKLIAPRRRMLIPGRAAVLLIATLALGPGLVTNLVLKDHWGRPRPVDVNAFAGNLQFVPWWDPRGDCPSNCSFVAGEPSGAFWTLAPAALLPPAWRGPATAAALVFGAGVGLIRMAGGGHFFSDVVFAGLFTFLIIWLTHGLLFRWPATRLSDRAIERALERLARPRRTRPPKPVDPSAAAARPKAAGEGG